MMKFTDVDILHRLNWSLSYLSTIKPRIFIPVRLIMEGVLDIEALKLSPEVSIEICCNLPPSSYFHIQLTLNMNIEQLHSSHGRNEFDTRINLVSIYHNLDFWWIFLKKNKLFNPLIGDS